MGTGAALETPLGTLPVAASGPQTLCLRPEALGTTGSLPLGTAVVKDAAFFGTHCRAHLAPEAAPEVILTAHLPPGDVPPPGTRIALAVAPEDLTVFPA
nr:TOBE domain-containing protein [Pseudooceanicola sp. HF7]